ncbi:hypothetical protein ACFVHW_33045 [Streptomyces sp. NPDC127110]|uniref:hypothetical protein n=1 Tax=Streptomyces sp. NPDC127110 TaxID=3345362 RepID=UPI0036264CBC
MTAGGPDIRTPGDRPARPFLHLAAPDGRIWWQAQVMSPAPPDLAGPARSGCAASRGSTAARGNRDAKTAGPLARRICGLVMPVGIRLFQERATAWLYTHDRGELPAVPPPAARAARTARDGDGFRQRVRPGGRPAPRG